MKPVFTELFVTKVQNLPADQQGTVRQAVDAVLQEPSAHDRLNEYPWEGCFEKNAGTYRIVYGVIDGRVIFRTIYPAL
jgi:mRNA-degrading endonuclease RelE of RelBE toxin-antitoxin system